MGNLPTLDMPLLLLAESPEQEESQPIPRFTELLASGFSLQSFTRLPYGAKHFAANTFLSSLLVGHYAPGGRKDGNPHPVHYRRYPLVTHINAATGLADTPGASQSAFPPFTVFDMNAKHSLFVVPYEFIILDISFFLQDAAQIRLHAGCRNINFVKARFLRIANTI
jgi:hypothetical protein